VKEKGTKKKDPYKPLSSLAFIQSTPLKAPFIRSLSRRRGDQNKRREEEGTSNKNQGCSREHNQKGVIKKKKTSMYKLVLEVSKEKTLSQKEGGILNQRQEERLIPGETLTQESNTSVASSLQRER